MLIFDHKMYSTGYPYGTVIFDLDKKNILHCRHNGLNTVNPAYATVSFPLSTGFNLVSGDRRRNDSILIYRIDSSLAIHAELSIADGLRAGTFKMITYDSGYAIANETELLFMDKMLVHQKWQRKLDGSIKNMLRISATEILVIAGSFIDGKYGVPFMEKIDVATGNTQWTTAIGYAYYSDMHVAITKDSQIMVNNSEEILRLSRDKGKVTGRRRINDADRDALSFHIITDPITGNHYYYTAGTGNVLYW